VAQSLDDLNIQFHGYATQAFLKTSQNNILTTNSSDGSPAWTEAVVNLSSTPATSLRIAVQARYSLIGTEGNAITLDFASVDYKVNERAGFRFGKVKTPSGLFNEIQDIDPGYTWSLLPQSVYPILSRNSLLSHYGGVYYGSASLGDRLGKIEYRGWGGESVVGANDGYLIGITDEGIALPNGVSLPTVGAALRWKTPVKGLLVGLSDGRNGASKNSVSAGGGSLKGSFDLNSYNQTSYFGQYEHRRFMAAAEYTRVDPGGTIVLAPLPQSPFKYDYRGWYGMFTYKATSKLTAGIYDSQYFNRQAALGPSRFSKDWALSARYDFNQFLYAKAEQHWIDGTAIGYDTANNPGGLQPDTRLLILKVGVSF
jgi:hypothetical protein